MLVTTRLGRLRPASLGRPLKIADWLILQSTLKGPVRYLLRDKFLDTRAAGSVHGTPATPGPGTRAVVDTGNFLSVTGGKAITSDVTGIGDPRLNYEAFTRIVGVMLIGDVNYDRRGYLGFDATQISSPNGSAIQQSNTVLYAVDHPSVAKIATVVISTDYQFLVVLRTVGAYYFIKGGTFTNWTLLYVGNTNSAATLYPAWILREGGNDVNSTTYIRIPVRRVLPRPLAYDSFARANGALASSEAAGPESQVIPARTWESGGATWTIVSNEAINTPTPGAEIITTNADFSAWTADDPDDWGTYGEVANDPECSEVAAGESHADAPTPGGARCNLYNSAAAGYPYLLSPLATS